ncbi:MAG: hypothetical protein L0387_08975 [Acidobacteria bacterium]|nr:hypothetical protein [Acidobacteriota bacterium]
MDLKAAQAVVLPAKGKSFDPTKIAKAVKEAGFTPSEITVTAAGTLARAGDLLQLNMSGPVPQLVLAGGAKADELARQTDLQGKRVRVTGKLHASHADQPPGIAVDTLEVLKK